MRQRVTGVTLSELDDSEDGTNHDEQTDSVEHIQALLPQDQAIQRLNSWCASHPAVEYGGNGTEHAEHDNLDDEPNDDDPLTPGGEARLLNHHQPGRASLDYKRDDVAEDKGQGELGRSDEGVFVGVDARDDSAEDHVNRSREQHGRDDDEHVLHGVGKYLARLVVCANTGSVPDNLNYWPLLVESSGRELVSLPKNLQRHPTANTIQKQARVRQIFQLM